MTEDERILLTPKECDARNKREREAAAAQLAKIEAEKQKADARVDAAHLWLRRLVVAILTLMAGMIGVKVGWIPHF